MRVAAPAPPAAVVVPVPRHRHRAAVAYGSATSRTRQQLASPLRFLAIAAQSTTRGSKNRPPASPATHKSSPLLPHIQGHPRCARDLPQLSFSD